MSNVKRYMVHWPAHDGDLVDAVKASDYDAAIAAKDPEIERLRAALRDITHVGPLGVATYSVHTYLECYKRIQAIVRAALKEGT